MDLFVVPIRRQLRKILYFLIQRKSSDLRKTDEPIVEDSRRFHIKSDRLNHVLVLVSPVPTGA